MSEDSKALLLLSFLCFLWLGTPALAACTSDGQLNYVLLSLILPGIPLRTCLSDLIQ